MNKRKLFPLVGVFAMLFLYGCCYPCAPATLVALTNPPLNSVVTAHGNTDWHIDTAEEFLYGTEMSGATTAANHVPDTWTKKHMHIGLTNTSFFYYDPDEIATGLDNDTTNGIDTAMLFFYAGHGSPTSWSTLGDYASQDNVYIGDSLSNGLLRYYWQCSCEVFAHGPRVCSAGAGTNFEYSCPEEFDGSPDSYEMRNVYERWGPALNADLRMACGASTSAYCHENQTNAIWYYYNFHVNDYGVADSFIHGLHDSTQDVVPLCITLGDSDVTQTPLFDYNFTNQPNTSGTSYYHIQFLDEFDWQNIPADWRDFVPTEFYKYPLIPLPDPGPLRDLKFTEEDGWRVADYTFMGQKTNLQINMQSGSIYLQGITVMDTKSPPIGEAELIDRAQTYIKELGWLENNKTISGPYGTKMMIASQPVNDLSQKPTIIQKNATVTFRRMIEVDGHMIEVLGDGGLIQVEMNNDGSLQGANIVWREIDKVGEKVKAKTYEEALREATAKLENPEYYQLGSWKWGYKEMDGFSEQTEMTIVFQFNFIPKDKKLQFDYPPQMIEILAEKGK